MNIIKHFVYCMVLVPTCVLSSHNSDNNCWYNPSALSVSSSYTKNVSEQKSQEELAWPDEALNCALRNRNFTSQENERTARWIKGTIFVIFGLLELQALKHYIWLPSN